MSVIVKSMEMPKKCSDCPLNYDQMSCSVTGTRWWSDTMVLMGFDSDKERLYDCPLVEIPTPHVNLETRLDQVIADITYVRSCLKLLKTIQESGGCNICKKKRTCEYVPKLGEQVRYNCPFFESEVTE